MATTLQRQLAVFSTPSSTVLIPERRRSSILFTPQEAAGYNRDTFYQIGLEGLYELISANNHLFKKFRDSILFDNASKNLERAIAEKLTNDKIDEAVEQFLITLSPFLMLKASLKCLEWLVYRFHIEKFNVNLILKCIMPYYDTKTFALIVQILEIEKFKLSKEWHWIVPNVQTAVPLSKASLYSNVNARFIGWLFETLHIYLKVHKQENLRIYISFMTSTIIGVLKGINENTSMRSKRSAPAVIHRIWTELTDLLLKIKQGGSVLKSNQEVHCMIYVICTLLVTISKEKPELVKGSEGMVGKVMRYTLKTHPRSLKTQAYLLLNTLAENSTKKLNLPNNVRLYRVLTELSVLSSEWDLWDLLSKIILNPTGLQEFQLSPNRIWKHLSRIEFTISQRSRILKTVYITLCNTTDIPKKKWANKFLSRFEREYPTEFSLASQANDQFAKDLAKHSKGEDVILLSQHHEIEIREQAVLRLLRRFKKKYILIRQKTTSKKARNETSSTSKIIKTRYGKQRIMKCKPDSNPIAQALHQRFSDHSEKIVRTLVKQKSKVLCKLFTHETLIELLTLVIQRQLSQSCTKAGLQNLIKIASKIPNKNSALKSKVFVVLIPFLFPADGVSPIIYAKTILSTKFAKQDSFLKQYSKDLKLDSIQAQSLRDFSYDIFSNKNPPFTLWSNKMDSASEVVFACLHLNTDKNFENLMAATESFECASSYGGYPVNKENFSKCLLMAKKKNILSLEIVFRAILEMELTDFHSLAQVIKFVLRSSLKVENRNVCAQFLQQFVIVTFKSKKEQLHFWCYMITCCQAGKENSFKSSEELEFYFIRALQFLTCFIEMTGRSLNNQLQLKIGYSPSKGASNTGASIEEEGYITELILSQCLLHNSYPVRLGGLSCLQAVVKMETVEPETIFFLNYVLSYREEILADKDQASVVISEVFRENKFPNIVDRFVEIVLHSKDQAIAIGLLHLCKFASSQIFLRFIPLVKELLMNDPESDVLMAILDCYDGSLEGTMDIVSASLKSKVACPKILSKFTQNIVEKYDFSTKKKLFAILIDSVLHCETADIKVAVQRCVRKWILEGSMIAGELEKCVVMQKLQASSGQAGNLGLRKKPKGKLSIDSSKSCFGNVQWTDRAEVILEFLQSDKKLKQKTKLIFPLFKLLKICIALEEQSPVEYLKQLILTAMTLCCYQDQKIEAQESNDWIHFNVETIIDCLRCSRNPQTHHHALILLNYAARKYPEQVLHGIMSLFTFMGSSILRQDDTYSTQLIQQTVTTIIPTLANTGAVGKFSKSLVSAGIFRVFTSAVQDIPIHRRLPVFTSLVETLEPTDSLWQVCIIIVDNALTRDKKRSNLNADIDLATDLVWNFEPEVVLKTLEKIYMYLIELQIYEDINDESFKSISNSQHALSRAVIDLGRKETLREVEIVILFTLELISKICGKFSDLDDQKLTYDFLLEKCLSYSRVVSRIREDKIFRLITQRNFEVIGKINAVLEPRDFVRVTKSILDRDDINVKKKIIDMLNHRIMQKAEWFKDPDVLLELLPPLIELGNSPPETEEMVTVIQITFMSLKLIARQLASTHPEKFVSVFELCLTYCSNKNRLLGASALLCISELFCLKSLILTNLEKMSSIILKAFKACAKLHSNESRELLLNQEENDQGNSSSTTGNLLCISTMTCVNKLTEQMGSFIGVKFLERVLVIVLSMDGIFGIGEKAGNRKKVFDLKLKLFMKTIATKMSLRNSLPCFVQVFKKLVKIQENRKSGIILLIDTLKETLQNSTEKLDFTTLLPTLCDAFLNEFLTYREILTISDPENQVVSPEDENSENAIIDCLISGIVLKMSEGIFRPFYHRLLDWASDSLPRLITFYRVSAAAAERLKSLFVTFAGYVITQSTATLQQDATLTQAILKYLYQIFLNDREGFITIDRFNALVKPILDLVECEYVIRGTINIKEVNEVLIQLAVATNDLNRWQYLIELISMKSQHTDSQVRLFVLSTLEAAGNELGKDFLPLLPPAVPFLAELLTDDDPKVEDEARNVLLKLEDIVGEPLQPYFSS